MIEKIVNNIDYYLAKARVKAITLMREYDGYYELKSAYAKSMLSYNSKIKRNDEEYSELYKARQKLLRDLHNEMNKYSMAISHIFRLKEKYEPLLPKDLKPATDVYAGLRQLRTKEKTYNYSLKPTEYFPQTENLGEFLNGVKEDMTELEKLNKILANVQIKLKYKYDHEQYWNTEHFSMPFEVAVSRKDDCESLTGVVVATARKAGIPATRIFMALGHLGGLDGFGHAYPVYRTPDNKWWVGEATRSKIAPFREWKGKLKRSYTADKGVCNDKFECRFKEVWW